MRNIFFLPLKNLKRRKLRSWLTILGILIGIATVVSLITLGNGLKAAVLSQFEVGSTEVIVIQAKGMSGYGAPGSGVTESLTRQDAEAIEGLSPVEKAFSRNIETVKIEYNDKLVFGMAMDIPEEDRDLVYEIVGIEAKQGHLLKEGEAGKIFIGSNYLDKEKNGFDREITAGRTVLIQDEEFKVAGILKKEGSFLLDNIVAMGNDDLQDLVGNGDDVDLIVAKVKNKDLIDKASEDIKKLLRKRRDVKIGEENFDVQTPEAALEGINDILGGVQAFIVIIAFISIIVGAIGIINTMTTSVLERIKEIGIMKSIGATNTDIFMLFLVESGMMGFVGGVIGAGIGVMIGYAGTLGINSFIGSAARPDFNIFLILFSLLGSFLIGAAAGIVPAMNAAKQNPVEALRK
jgi:putative ABC transport system permease protein